MTGFFLIFELVYLMTWTIVDRERVSIGNISLISLKNPHLKTFTTVESGHNLVKVCESDYQFWWGIFISLKILFLFCAAVIAVKSRRFQPIFNESKESKEAQNFIFPSPHFSWLIRLDYVLYSSSFTFPWIQSSRFSNSNFYIGNNWRCFPSICDTNLAFHLASP